MHRPSPDLWAARLPDQIFAVELHSKPISNGPGIVFSSLIPDMHHFRGSQGGRALPLYHPGGRPNLATGLAGALSTITGTAVTAEDLIAYIAGVAAHPAYTDQFVDELTTPGVRIPITTDATLFQRAIDLGSEIIWLHTYGDRFSEGRSGIRYESGDTRRITNQTAITTMPTTITYDPETATIHLGSGTFGPVPQEVWDYTIDDKPVVNAWFNYRKANPTGLKTSPLDDISASTWPTEWNGELIDLLTVLARLVELHPAQAELLDEILAHPLASYTDLAAAGVTWPTASSRDAQRKPDYSTQTDPEETGPGQLGFTFGGQ